MSTTVERSASDEAASVAAPASAADKQDARKKKKRKHPILHFLWMTLLVLLVCGVIARLCMPRFLRWYVNRTLDQNPLYDGRIGDIEVHLWRGAYSIDDVRLNKITGNVPVPLFAAKRVDLAIQWDALIHGKLVGRVLMETPELNFVDAPKGDESQTQTGAGGPWLDMLRELFPFKLNKAIIKDGSIHFRAYHSDPPVDLYLTELQAEADNLTNIQNSITPLLSTVKARGTAMNTGQLEYQMKLDPFSYKPTFQMALRLVSLDVTKLNDFARAYGGVDFENGIFDLVIEIDSKEGSMEGYVKPLFRRLRIVTMQDVKEDNPLELFWEGVVGVTARLLSNQPHDQLATVIPLRGDVSAPNTDVFATVLNVLRNAFIRAYQPKLRGVASDINHLEMGRGSVTEPSTVGSD